MYNVSHCEFPHLLPHFSYSSTTPSLTHTEKTCKQAQIHDMLNPCLSPSSDSINGALGADDSRIRLMSCRPKAASRPTSSGSTLTLLSSAPTKPYDSWYRLFTMHPRIPVTPVTPVTPCLCMSQFMMSRVGVEPSSTPKPRPWWHSGLKRGETGNGDVTGLGFIIDEWTWMRSRQSRPFEDSSSQNKCINGSTSETQRMVNILTGCAIQLTPLWHLIFPQMIKGHSVSFVYTLWPPQLNLSSQ